MGTRTRTKIAPENKPGPKRKRSYANHPFFRCEHVSFREGKNFGKKLGVNSLEDEFKAIAPISNP